MAGQTWVPYCGVAPLPADWLARWNFDPVLIAALLAAAALPFVRKQAVAGGGYWPALALMALLFVSPFCALTSALFSARVTHHLVLTALVAPLLAYGLPRLRVPGSAAMWAAIHAVVFWFWHAPQPYSFALTHDAAYWAMQLTLLGSGLAMWSALRRTDGPVAIFVLLATMVQMGLLGALITFAAAPVYAPHFASTMPWGIGPLDDQQLAGLIMWAPGSALYLAAALVIGWRMLGQERATA